MQLESDFETKLRDALVEDMEATLFGEADNLTFRFVQEAHERLRAFGDRHDMHVEPIIESMEIAEAERTPNGVRARVEWTHEAAGFFEMGTSPHVIEGNPVLSFVWEEPPQWVRETFPQARSSGGQFRSGWRVFFEEVQHPGMPAARYIRDAIEWLRQEVD